jgi:hypothetical protein
MKDVPDVPNVPEVPSRVNAPPRMIAVYLQSTFLGAFFSVAGKL